MELCDVHCHILPGVDDGARTMEETIQVLQEAARQGIRHMIVTPHYYPDHYMVPGPEIHRILYGVQRQCLRRGIEIRLYPGHECYYYSGLVEELAGGSALTLAGSRYVLVEFDPDCLFSYMQSGLQRLRSGGYLPILAHFERYTCLDSMDNLMRVRQEGTLLQMNFDTMMRKNTLFHRYQWRELLREGIVDYLGSDCHGTHFRPLHVAEACRWMDGHILPEIRDRILYENVSRIFSKK